MRLRVLAEGGNVPTANQHSRYSLQFAMYGSVFFDCFVGFAPASNGYSKKPIARWTGAILSVIDVGNALYERSTHPLEYLTISFFREVRFAA